MSRTGRPKDAVFTKFTGPVMSEICGLMPDFISREEAVTFYTKLLRRPRVKRMLALRFPNPSDVPTNSLSYNSYNNRAFCWWQAENGPELAVDRRNPMEVLHLFAHIVQPEDTAMHKGEFGKIFLALIELVYDSDKKRAAKDILLSHGIRTSTKSPEARAKQADAYNRRRVSRAPEGLLRIMHDLSGLRSEDDE